MCLTEQEKRCNDAHLKVQTQILDKPAGGAPLCGFCYITIIAASRFYKDLPGSRSDARALFLEARSREILQLVREGLHAVINKADFFFLIHYQELPSNTNSRFSAALFF